MTARLIAEEGALEGLVLSFEQGDQWIIGRDPKSCQFVVEDPEVAKQHMVAKRQKDGQIILENLAASAPPLVNDEPLAKPRILKHGDSVALGGGIFRFYTELGAPDTGEEAPPRSAKPALDQEAPAADSPAPEKDFDSIFDEIDAEQHKVLAEINFDLSETGRWLMKVIAGPNNGAEFAMEPGRSYIVGTAPNACDIVFHDVSVSRQHARITISSNNKASIEDMKSRNGTLVDDKKIQGRTDINSKSVITVGTTSFVVFDRESDRDTIITPLLPGIVRTLQRDDAKKGGPAAAARRAAAAPPPPKKGRGRALGLIVLGLVIFGVIGTATSTLFQSSEITKPEVDVNAAIKQALAVSPDVKYSFNGGKLLLIGHVLKASDQAQLLYNLQALDFVKDIDDRNVVIDEYVVRETNQTLADKNEWRGVSLQATSPGHFALNGYIKARKEADKLADYMAKNFAYLDRLENNVIVEEDVTAQIGIALQDQGLRDVTAKMNNGELNLSGSVSSQQAPKLEELMAKFKQNPAVRSIQNFVVTVAPEASIIDLTDSYKVTGSSTQAGTYTSVVINGRILGPGDIIDGMTLSKITGNTLFLEKEGVKYKIEYSK